MQPIALAAVETEKWLHRLHREWGTVDREFVEAVTRPDARGNGQHYAFVRRRGVGFRLGEASVVPAKRLRLLPLGLALGPGIFDDNAHTTLAVFIDGLAQNPNAGVLHLDDGRDALSCTEPKNRHRHRVWHQVAVERHDLEQMARQRQAADLAGARVQHVEEHALARLDSDRLTLAKDATVDREEIVGGLVALLAAGL